MNFANKKLRHELKYYIHLHEYYQLRNRISSVLKLDKHASSHEGYHIRSLYFDTISESAYYQKINGIFHRKKYRIRIYNLSSDYIMLERKSKYNEYICKESTRLSLRQYEDLMRGNFESLHQKDPLQLDFYKDLKLGHMKPSIIVDYIREAYTYPISDVRITFDKKLCSGLNEHHIFEPQLITAEVLESQRLILEVKFNQFLPQHIRQLIQLSQFQRSAISKYVLCLNKKLYGYY